MRDSGIQLKLLMGKDSPIQNALDKQRSNQNQDGSFQSSFLPSEVRMSSGSRMRLLFRNPDNMMK